MANAKYKPLSFSTTMRNPERIAKFLSCLTSFENKTLTNELIDDIVFKIIKNKLYKPYYIDRNPVLKNIFLSDDLEFSDKQVQDIIDNSPQDHKEAGFDKGWPSRFDTWYKLQKEFGFLWYSMLEPIKISESGHMLIDAVNSDPEDNNKIQNVFLNALSKYQANNPFRKTLNSNNPLVLLCNVLKIFKDNDKDFKGIHRSELAFFICWPNNDSHKLYEFIKDFRSKHSFSAYTDEIIYHNCLENLGYSLDDRKYIKMDRVTGEAVDEYIRKMKITGILSLRGNGRFLDFNTIQQNKIDYLLNLNIQTKEFGTEKEFYNYISTVDNNFFDKKEIILSNINEIKINKLNEIANMYSIDDINKELVNVCNKKESQDPIFKFINAPARLEFLTSISLKQNFENLDVYPSYPVDDEGLPTFTAGGNIADIICRDVNNDEFVEVTLMTSKDNQIYSEIIPICRHQKEAKQDNNDIISVFIAPRIHPDTIKAIEWNKHIDNVNLVAYTINDFILESSKYDSFESMLAGN